MKSTFDQFKNNFEKRFQLNSILNLGEDSVRYDFFDALKSRWNLEVHQIQLEFPLSKEHFNSFINPNSKRPENPQLDLLVSTETIKIIAEFALFKRNGNLNGAVNFSERIFKMFNDFIRLGNSLTSFKGEAYFICIADSKMLGSNFRNSKFESFPALNYSLAFKDLIDLTNMYKSGVKIDKRFLSKTEELGIEIQAKLVYNEKIMNPIKESDSGIFEDNHLETRVIVYKISISE